MLSVDCESGSTTRARLRLNRCYSDERQDRKSLYIHALEFYAQTILPSDPRRGFGNAPGADIYIYFLELAADLGTRASRPHAGRKPGL